MIRHWFAVSCWVRTFRRTRSIVLLKSRVTPYTRSWLITVKVSVNSLCNVNVNMLEPKAAVVTKMRMRRNVERHAIKDLTKDQKMPGF